MSNPTAPRHSVLAVNVGSSTLKAALYSASGEPNLLVSLAVDRIGTGESTMTVSDEPRVSLQALDHSTAFVAIADWIAASRFGGTIAALGHRIVHGGDVYTEPALLDEAAVARLDELVALDPDHMPQSLATLAAARAAFPDLPQIGLFDTAFHHTMPPIARTLPLPRQFADAGMRRYGFHGLSYESIVTTLRASGDLPERLIVAHLGAGSSLCAIRDGISINTTMGFTPTGGVMMGTRSGDLDPGVVIALLRQHNLSVEEIELLLNKESGLLGVSGTSADMRDLEARAASDPQAALAIDLYCALVRRAIGSLATDLGGVDTIVFTAGIGENSPSARASICALLGFLGLEIDPERNQDNARIISTDRSRSTVMMVPTDENAVIARATTRFIA